MIISLFSLLIYRSCWVCFATDEDDRTAEWVRPCRCRGSTKWVHQACLQRWVDEKQRGNILTCKRWNYLEKELAVKWLISIVKMLSKNSATM